MGISEARAAELRELVGEPADVADSLAQFRRAASALSSDRPRLIDQYPQKWVAVLVTDEVIAADSLAELLAELQERGIERDQALVRFIDRAERTLFL